MRKEKQRPRSTFTFISILEGIYQTESKKKKKKDSMFSAGKDTVSVFKVS